MSSSPVRPKRASTWMNRRTLRKPAKILLRALPFIIIIPLFLQVLLAYRLARDPRLLPPQLRQAKSLLVVTAHPDDECLFFSPSILAVLNNNPKTTGGLIVLSTGNNYGLGELRKTELAGSCENLGIDKRRCLSHDIAELQDNPKVWWSEEAIMDAVKVYINKWNIDAILTFDDGGISGHINHRAVSAALSNYAATNPEAPATYLLQSTALFRKYSLLGDLPLTALPFSWRIFKAVFTSISPDDGSYGDRALVASTWSSYVKTRHAFASHTSQYSWDRVLYLVFSRHIWFNDLKRVAPPSAT